MNGRLAKELRKIAANPQLSEVTKYTGIQHQKVMYREYFDPITGAVEYRPEGVVRIQVVMDVCQRKAYKVWKARVNTFKQRSDTLPYRGLSQKHQL